MMRAISIILIVAIALQTVGCSTWKPLARVNEDPKDDRQSSMRDQVLGKLTEGMRVRLRIREGARTQIKGEVVECVVKEIGPSSLELIPFTFFTPGNIVRTITLDYSDIASIEYRETGSKWETLGYGVGVGSMLAFFLFIWALSGIELD